jgi:hypothetical protein
MIIVSPIPAKESEASNVRFFLLFLGIDPFARFPLGARAYKRVRAMFDPQTPSKDEIVAIKLFDAFSPEYPLFFFSLARF